MIVREREHCELKRLSWQQDMSEPAEGCTAAAGRALEVMGPSWTQGIQDIQAALETLGLQVTPAPLCLLLLQDVGAAYTGLRIH